jgi:hypothetical protein
LLLNLILYEQSKMSTPSFELIILENGDIGLQRAGVDETLVQVKFSSKVKDYLGEHHIEVAKQMIDSGIQAVIEWEQAAAQAEEQEPSKTVH